MAARAAYQTDPQVAEFLVASYADPLHYVLGAFPWGRESLADAPGPDDWQIDVLEDLRDGIISVETSLRLAVASGHGIGKTALIAWIVLWFISTRPNPQIVVTANTAGQLATTTWREIEKWRALAVNGDQLTWTATKLIHKSAPGTWFATATPWSEHNSEAFAGKHEKHVLFIFDEASKIADVIWQVSEGAMTTAGAIWIAFGNPTMNTGRFFEACFGKLRKRWKTRSIDSRTARMADQRQIQEWLEDYGEDSDFFRVRVRGLPPRAGIGQLIPSDKVEEARERLVEAMTTSPLILGGDVARDGDDQSVLAPRQGLLVRPLYKHRIPDLMRLAAVWQQIIDELEPDAVCIDATGMGAGVYDRLVQLNYGSVVHPVIVGEQAQKPERFYNRGAELWWLLREFITKEPCSLPERDVLGNPEIELYTDLTNRLYGHDARDRVQLERKKDMKARGLDSPDNADAVALTFAVAPRKRFPWEREERKRRRLRQHSWRA